jgi:hydroxymethylpyrimidine pyrophosphatase-like HAD family hydrolase
MNTQYKLLVTDIDGTIANKRGVIEDPDLKALQDIHQQGSGLAALISYLKLQRENVVAIGDGANDVSLLSGAGLAIAMDNAPVELKSVSDFVTTDVENNGVARAIKRFFYEKGVE